jgi:sugar phosphate isomerase/epimerase
MRSLRLKLRTWQANRRAEMQAISRRQLLSKSAIDWKNVFAAAKKAGVKGYFVEQEPPFERPPLEAIKLSYSYLLGLKDEH